MKNDSTIFVGLDVHKDSITVACVGLLPDAPVIDIGTIGTQQYAIDRLIAVDPCGSSTRPVRAASGCAAICINEASSAKSQRPR